MMFGKKLRLLREEKELSQKEMADHLQITRQAYNYYENDKRNPDYDTLRAIADYFNVSTDYLLGQQNEQESKVTDALVDDPELQAFWDTMKGRDDLQLMFKKTKELSPAAIKQIIGIIKLIEDREDEEFGQ